MATIEIKKNEAPRLRAVKFVCDAELHNKLNDYEITRLMNRHNFTAFLGKAGSGKTSLLTSFLKTPQLFYRVYERIYVFMPAASRSSMKDSFFDKCLPEEHIFDDLDAESLEYVYYECQQSAAEGHRSLVIFDDVQKYFKEPAIAKILLHMVSNRRHSRLSMWLVCQNYRSLSKQVRMGITDLFAFKINKAELANIYEDHIEQTQQTLDKIQKYLYKKPHDFMYINTATQRIFSNWDEIVVNED